MGDSPLRQFLEHLVRTLEFFERVVQPHDTPSNANFESEIGRRYPQSKFERIHRRKYHYRKPTPENDLKGFVAVETFLNVDQIEQHSELFKAAYDAARSDGTANDLCQILSAASDAFEKLLPLRLAMVWEPDDAIVLWNAWRELEQQALNIKCRLPNFIASGRGTDPNDNESEIASPPSTGQAVDGQPNQSKEGPEPSKKTGKHRYRLIDLRALKAIFEEGKADAKLTSKAKNWLGRDWIHKPAYGKPKWFQCKDSFSEDEQTEIVKLKSYFEQKPEFRSAQNSHTKPKEAKNSVAQK